MANFSKLQAAFDDYRAKMIFTADFGVIVVGTASGQSSTYEIGV